MSNQLSCNDICFIAHILKRIVWIDIKGLLKNYLPAINIIANTV